MGADHLAGTAAHQLQETDILIAQQDITHTASADIGKAPHHITLTPLPSQDPIQHQTLTWMRNKQNPEEDPPPLTLMLRKSTQLNHRVTWMQMTLTQK